MLLRGFSDALLMRSQQAVAAGNAVGFLPPDHYDQIFTAHGVIMIFFCYAAYFRSNSMMSPFTNWCA